MTDEQLLRLALNGDENGWQELRGLCLTRTTAERLAKLLEGSNHQKIALARVWADLLEELHPALKITLPSPTISE